ncbi:MAG TPA: TrbG/VirB9 family P-type conjugative transfer protein [Candidatus Babeliales bacterium]|nr:TrbG/VirB9 family P-type conjugative transfer protein [Candidatus Babeliales bacterium]
MKQFVLSAIAFFITANASTTTFAAIVPRGVAADHRVKVVQYDPNNVVVLNGRYGYQTQITFATNESIQSVSIGDSMAWQAVPVANNLFIKPVVESSTNMTVLTNTNSYNFQLDSTSPGVTPTYKLQFTYLEGGYDQTGSPNAVASFEPDKLNWKYSFTGDRSIAPIEAFDNGQFTYLKFKSDGMSHLPSVFIVDKNRNETLVNYHMQGQYLVMNAVAKQFTLRDGDYVASVYNDFAIGDWKRI